MATITFNTEAKYIEAWRYCMRVRISFKYISGEHWIEPTPVSPEEDKDTMDRLEGIANSVDPALN